MTWLRRACLLPVVGLLAACAIPADDAARPLDPSAAPFGLQPRDREAVPAGSHRIVLFLARDGGLVPVPRRIAEPPTPESVLRTLAAGPTDAEQARGLTTVLPPNGDPQVAAVDDGLVTISLPAPPEENARADAVLGFGQLVLTMTALPSISSVLLEHEGARLQIPRADGSLSAMPLTRDDYRELVDRG